VIALAGVATGWPVWAAPAAPETTGQADLGVIKTVASGTIFPGSTVQYQIHYANSGDLPANGVILTDTLPAGLSYYYDTSPLSWGGVQMVNDRTLVWSAGTIPAGQSGEFLLVVRADANLPVRTILANTITATTTSLDNNLTNNQSIQTVTVVGPDLSLTKIGPTPLRLGDTIVYTLIYTNTGNWPATAIRLTDTLPLSFILQSSTPSPTLVSGLDLVWELGNLGEEASGRVLLTGTLPASVAVGMRITNSARIATPLENALGDNQAVYTATVEPGLPATLNLTATPNRFVVGSAPAVVMATVRDLTGNPVADGTPVTFTVTLPGVSPVAYLRTISGGEAAITITSNLAGVILVQARAGAIQAETTLVADPGPTELLYLSPSPAALPVGNTSILTARLLDRFGNPVTDGTLVNFTTTLGQIGSPKTTLNGTASTPLSSTVAGPAQVTASAGGRSDITTVTFWPGPPHSLTLSANPATLPVGQSSQLTALVRDSYGNAVANGTPVAFRATSGTLNASPATSNGVATATLTAMTAGAVQVFLSAGDKQVTTTVTFVAGTAANVTLTANPAATIVGGDPVTLIARASDAYGNPVADGTVANFATSLGYLWPPSPPTTLNGVAVTYLRSGQAGTAAITVTIDSRPAYTSVLFLPGPPADLRLMVERPVLPVAESTLITATVRDNFGNLVEDGTLVTFTSSLGTIISPRVTVSGVATTSLSSIVAGAAIVHAEAGEQSADTSVTFTPGPPARVFLSASPAVLTVGGRVNLSATVNDLYGNAVADGTRVTFTTSLGQVASPRSTANGFAYSTLSSQVAGTAQITARADGQQGMATATFLPGPAQDITLTLQPPIQTVGGTILVGVRTTDRFGNAVADGTPVTLTSTLGDIVSPVTTTNGLVTTTLTSVRSGQAEVTATVDDHQTSAFALFLAGPAQTVTLLTSATSVVAGGSVVLTTTARDQYANPVTDGTLVTYQTSLGTITSPRTTTSGVATTTLTSRLAGQAVVTTTVGDRFASTTVIFAAGQATSLTLVATPATLPVGEIATLVARATDANDNPVADGRPIQFATTLGTLTGNPLTHNGTATMTLGSLVAGRATVSAAIDGRMATRPVTFTAGPVTTLTLNIEPASLPVGTMTATVIASVTDRYHNPVADGTPVVFTYTFGSTVQVETRTTRNGTATLTAPASTRSGRATIQASCGLVRATAFLDYTPGLPAAIALTSARPALPADGFSTTVLTATVTDRYVNAVADGTLVLFVTSLGSFGGTTSLSQLTTGGIATVTLTASAAPGAARVTAFADTVSSQLDLPIQAANLSLIKRVTPAVVVPGDLVSFTLIYSNTGPGIATRVQITDIFGENLINPTFIASGAPLEQLPGHPYTWSTVNLGQNQGGVITVVAQVNPGRLWGPTTTLTNSATIRAATAEAVPGNETAIVSFMVQTADVGISHQGPTGIFPGQGIQYVISYFNRRDAAEARNTLVTDTLPPGTLYYGDTGGSLPTVSPDKRTIVWNLGTLAPGQGGSFTLMASTAHTLPAGLQLVNVVTITTRTQDSDLSNNEHRTTTIVQATDLQISKTGPARVVAGGLITYTLIYTNAGNLTAQDVRITDTFPAGINYVGASPAPVVVQNNQPVWHLGNLGVGANGRITLWGQVVITSSATLTNLAEIAGAGPEGTLDDNIATFAIVVEPVDLAVYKAGPATAQPGATITYTLAYRNQGPVAVAGVRLTDTLPAGAIFRGDDSGLPRTGSGNGPIVWSVLPDPLLPAASRTFIVTITLPTTPGQVSNVAQIGAPAEEADLTNNTATVFTLVTTTPPTTTLTSTPTRTSSATATASPTSTSVPANTPTPTPLTTHTPTPTQPTSVLPTPTSTGTATSVPTSTATFVPTPTPTPTRSLTPSHTPTPTPTRTKTPTPTITSTPTITPTLTPTPTTGRIEGIVWNDRNGNGQREVDEPTLAGATITLWDSHSLVVGRQTTTISGRYAFANLMPGNYLVQEQNPPGYLSTTPDAWSVYVAANTVQVVNFGDWMPTPTPTSTPEVYQLYLPITMRLFRGSW